MADTEQSKENLSKGEKKQARQRRWTEAEVVTLASLVKSRRDLLFGSGNHGFGVEHKKREMWEEVAERIEAAGGVNRGGWEAMRRKWADVSFRAKKYQKDRQGINKTGGGPQPSLNPGMEAVLDALPGEVTDGIVPLGRCETIPELQDSSQPKKDVPEGPREPQIDLTQKAGPSGSQKYGQCTVDANSQSSTSTDANSQEKQAKRKRKETNKKRKHQKKETSLMELNRELLRLEKEKVDIQR